MPGDMVRVSIGGMSQTTVRCLTKGADGILAENQAGERFKILWTHVIGPADKEKPLKKSDTDEAPFVVSEFVIRINPLNVIGVPSEFAGDDELTEKWRLAMHEAGHAVVAQLLCGCGGAGIERLSGQWHGIAYDYADASTAKLAIAVAGIASEALGGEPAFFQYRSPDYKYAKLEKLAQGHSELEIPELIASDTAELARELASGWVKAIRAVAMGLCKQGWMSGDQIADEMGDAQAILSKSLPGPMRKVSETFPVGRWTPKKIVVIRKGKK